MRQLYKHDGITPICMVTETINARADEAYENASETVGAVRDEALDEHEAMVGAANAKTAEKVENAISQSEFWGGSEDRAQAIQNGVMRVLAPIIAIGVGIVVAAELVPQGIADFQTATNESNVSGGAEGMLGLIGLVVALAILIAFLSASNMGS